MKVRCCPVRVQIGLMFFLTTLISYQQHVSISVLMIEMVLQTEDGNKTVAECYKRKYIENSSSSEVSSDSFNSWKPEKLIWDKTKQGHIRGAYFYGYMIMNLLGGPLAENFGPRLVLCIGLSVSALAMAFLPVFANISWVLIFVIRILVGLGSGVVFPCGQTLIARWAPPNERGKFSLSFMGGNFGTVVTFPILGFLCVETNWIVAVLLDSAVALLGTAVIFFVVRNYPEEHPRISPQELEYIKREISSIQKHKKALPPYRRIIFSWSFFGLVCLQFGGCWGTYFLLTSQPQYMADVMGFKATMAGIYSAMPHIGRLICGVGFSFLGDWMRKKAFWSITVQRKFFSTLSHIVTGAFMGFMAFNECSLAIAILLPTIALSINGASVHSNIVNSLDLAPNFAGTIFGIANLIGSTAGFIVSALVGYMTKGKEEYELLVAWKYIFAIAGVIYIISGVIFLIFGSAKLQDYNTIPEEINK